jgi:hypothetical protein
VAQFQRVVDYPVDFGTQKERLRAGDFVVPSPS